MTARTTTLHIPIDDKVKAEAAEVLARIGLSFSDAVRLLLHRVIEEQGIPIALKVPNARTQAAMLEARRMMAARRRRSP